MIYVALLRGINVGGNNKINMKELKAAFENSGMNNVFNISIKVLLRSIDEIRAVLQTLPSEWINDKTMRSNVMFLWEEIEFPGIMEKLKIHEEVDNVSYIPRTILWNTPGDLVTKSGLMNLAGTALYKKMTVRNVNTARKLGELMVNLENSL